MTKGRWKKWLIGCAMTPVLLAGAFVGLIGPWPLDLDTQDEAVITRAVEQAEEASAQIASLPAPAPLEAGWAVVGFDLPEGIPLGGYGARRGAPSEPGGDTPYARAVWLSAGKCHAVIVMADVLLINRALAKTVLARVEQILGTENMPMVIFTATHTHSGPGAWGAMKLEQWMVAGPYDERVFEALANGLEKAILGARAARGAASMAFLRSEAPEFIRNRAVAHETVDPTLEAMVLRREDTGALAVVGLFGAHATCLGANHMRLSRDYPGFFVDALEENPAIDFAGFAAGCVGSHSGAAPGSGMEKAQNLGKELAQRVRDMIANAHFQRDVRMATVRAVVDLPKIQFRLGEKFRASSLISEGLHDGTATFGVLRVDDWIWISLPVELSGMISASLREEARERGFELTLSCFNGNYLGYVLPDKYYRDGKLYEARMNFLGPKGGTYVREVIEALLPSQVPK